MKQGRRNFRLLAFMFALFGLLALSAGMAYGQAVDGNIVGTVVDSQGAVVVGAEVSTTNLATALVARLVVDTSAPTTTAPCESTTVPTMLPSTAWPYAIPALSASKPKSANINAKSLKFRLPCFIICFLLNAAQKIN